MAPSRCVWCSADLGQLQTSHGRLNADASKDTLSMQFPLSMVNREGGRL